MSEHMNQSIQRFNIYSAKTFQKYISIFFKYFAWLYLFVYLKESQFFS